MKTNNSNFENLLKQRFEEAQINPPDFIWQNIEKSIPHYIYFVNYKAFILNTFVILVGIGLISLSVIYTNEEKISNKEISSFQLLQQPDTSSFTIYKPLKKFYGNNVREIINHNKQIQVKIKNTGPQKIDDSLKEEKIIYLNANKYNGKGVDVIEILDESDVLLKKIENPEVNEYGYYEIKITIHKDKRVKVKVYTKDGNIFFE